jgi:glycosyltransferase involved in cell wall biosynthesis
VADTKTTSVVIPAHNEGPTIGAVVEALRHAAIWHEIIVVDDGSTDDTGTRALAAGAMVVRHPYNKGNGASVKTGLRTATGTFVLIMDADGQHAASEGLKVVARLGEYDLVIGSREGEAQATIGRRAGNALLNWIAGYLTGQQIRDLTSGLRGARLEYLREFLWLLPNGFSTPTTTTMAFVKAGYNVCFEPIDVRQRVGQSKIKFARDGFRFFLILLKVVTIFSPLRIFVPLSLVAFACGAGYALWTAVTQRHITNSSAVLIVLSVMIFLVGLVSEQISALRAEGRQ